MRWQKEPDIDKGAKRILGVTKKGASPAGKKLPHVPKTRGDERRERGQGQKGADDQLRNRTQGE